MTPLLVLDTCQLQRNLSVEAVFGLRNGVKENEAILLIIFFGVFASCLAQAFNYIRSKIYLDKNSLDVAFDAGGKVNAGLTATTIVSQWTWAATLLQSSTVTAKYGLSGAFWYASGATIQILLFAMISVQLKIKAPGAKTFLQVIKARFGPRTHKTFCVFAMLTNIIVTAMLMLGGAAVLTNLIKGISLEYATVLITAVIGAYTFIGGLGATFYVSYFNTSVIYIIIIVIVMKVYNDGDSSDNPLGSIEKVYDFLSCAKGPVGNKDQSYLTIISLEGLMFGLINIVGNFGTVFVDQSYWQSSVAAKPKEGMLGFLFGGLCWFAIPFALGTTTGLAYIALGVYQDAPLLPDADVDAGLVPPVVVQTLMGNTGEFLIIVIILMAVTSTGSAEIIAVTSILVYDIYQLYLKPFRLVLDSNSCILCGRARGRMANPRDKCTCESMMFCEQCRQDDKQRSECKRALKPHYTCERHGKYREYTDFLWELKNWCLLWTTLSILPLTFLLSITGVSLSWIYLFMGIVIGSAVIPIALSMFWNGLTGDAMVCGAISGTTSALIVWLSIAASYDGGLRLFWENTGKNIPMLCGNIVSITISGVVTITFSIIQRKHQGLPADDSIWDKTLDINNPLSPWTELYEKDLHLTSAHCLDNRPSLLDVSSRFRGSRRVAMGASVFFSIILVILWPCMSILGGVFTKSLFRVWVTVAIVWVFLAAMFIIIVPLVTEACQIHSAFKQRRVITPDCRKNLRVNRQMQGRSSARIHDSPVQLKKQTSVTSLSYDTGPIQSDMGSIQTNPYVVDCDKQFPIHIVENTNSDIKGCL